MSTPPNIPSAAEAAANLEAEYGGETWHYDLLPSPRQEEAVSLVATDPDRAKAYFESGLQLCKKAKNQLDALVSWANGTIIRSPAGVDLAIPIDDWGNSAKTATASLYGPWVDVGRESHLRFSQSHSVAYRDTVLRDGVRKVSSRIIRTPIRDGIVLEATNDPDSKDPRDAVALTLLKLAVDAKAKSGSQALDLSKHRRRPTGKPLIRIDHPNLITSKYYLNKVRLSALCLLILMDEQATR